MRKRFLHYINILLGVASMALAGCHAKQAAVAEVVDLYGVPAPEEVEEADSIVPPPDMPMLKYGIPMPPEVKPLYGVPVPEVEEK